MIEFYTVATHFILNVGGSIEVIRGRQKREKKEKSVRLKTYLAIP